MITSILLSFKRNPLLSEPKVRFSLIKKKSHLQKYIIFSYTKAQSCLVFHEKKNADWPTLRVVFITTKRHKRDWFPVPEGVVFGGCLPSANRSKVISAESRTCMLHVSNLIIRKMRHLLLICLCGSNKRECWCF